METEIRFLVDECTGPSVAKWLSKEGYEVFSVFDESPGINDKEILKKAYEENWVIITNDKDFSDLIFKDLHPHRGVIFLRLSNERSINKINCLEKLLTQFPDKIKDQFVVVTETNVRIANQKK
jgi:predicted nuclease of predicted toxin-antitoxin system